MARGLHHRDEMPDAARPSRAYLINSDYAAAETILLTRYGRQIGTRMRWYARSKACRLSHASPSQSLA